MDYCVQILGKSIRELKYQDVENFFQNRQQESDVLEFKSFNDKTNINDIYKGLYRAVCSLSNSNGGLIIWGAPEGRKIENQKEKIFQDNLTSIDPTIEKDFLVSKISSNIIPIVSDFVCEIIRSKKGNICLIEVQKSNSSPHQTDNTYYMRLDGQSRPAPHHYIEALFKQVKYPNIEGYIKIKNMNMSSSSYSDVELSFVISTFIINFSPMQNEENLFWKVSSNVSLGNYEESALGLKTYSRSIARINVLPVLGYGQPYKYLLSLSVRINDLDKVDREIDLKLYFGGKYSPIKRSTYRICIPSSIRTGAGDYNDYIQSKNENQFLFKADAEEGSTKELQLKELLGR